MRRSLGLAIPALIALGCGRHEPAAPVPTSLEQTRTDVPEPEAPLDLGSPPLPFDLAPRPDTFFVAQSCLHARGSSAAEARLRCEERRRKGDRFERRRCDCDPEGIVEVRQDAPVAFYVGCCWSVGETPQHARDACERQRERGCEPADPERVHIASGPYVRKEPFREFDGPDFRYLVPSNMKEHGWIAENGEGPCFPDGTPVELADGPRPIEDVRPGDDVVTLRDGHRVLVPVRGIKVREADLVLVFTFDDGVLRLTPNHLVWLEDDWQPASAVEQGDVLVGLDGPRTVRRIAEEHERVIVRTLRVGEPNSFFAGGVWVHNY